LNIDNEISPLPVWCNASKPSVSLHLRNFNKRQLIPTKFYTNSAPFIGNQTAKFQLNLPKQTTATAAFVGSPQNSSVSGFCG